MNNQRDIDLAPLSSSNNVENGDSQRGALSCSPPSSEDSPIRHLLEHHQRFLTDAHAPTFASFHLSSQHFDTYEAEISRLFRRYDYDRNRATITIRMPRAQAPKKTWSRQPDLQIGEWNTQFPGCVVEVACSQSSANLEPLAYDYFSNTSFGVQLFIFVDIKENARISVLRGNAGVVTWGMQQVEFQTADKHPANINLALELNVKDFVLSTEVGQYPDLAIRIPFQELHEMLRQARRDSLVKKGRGGNIRRPNKFDGEMVLPANFRTTKDPVVKGDGQFNGNQTTDEVTERQGAYGFRPRE
ncbi:hypothetical protein FOXG_13251 [Fusarium oxysporum f. sp. lycopersici 4287]|uniref:Uncharacterized protein n=1 Tax=Fusarium oxysporum f. sp. lycopersici (strain 4287 / CBS 123668 / FGSC 9935 / NRRL 34936) TaxID=426428 RepID=A0A0J9VTR5_FUSO4|nr:hypothetical protein FOXG_13251 [Fusarium oxysporum f. sp. lycopersici 4287]KNB14384.1 hypothetical protein FOXG_13251 [Fusarium oxysporum f. sp. lycopersici 4287]